MIINKWTIESLQIEVNKYKTRSDLCYKNSSAYSFAHRHNLLDELFKNHINKGFNSKRKKNGYWSEEKLQYEANKYETRSDFYKQNNSAYSIAHRNGIINELFKNHINKGYIDREEWKENSYVIYVYELPEFNKAYVGLTNNIERRDKEHLFSEKEKMILFCKENDLPLPDFKILEDNLNSKNVGTQERYWEQFYRDNGWEMFNIAKTGNLGGYDTKWTKKILQEEANKYESRVEFKKNHDFAYRAAKEKGILNELFENHINNGYSKKLVRRGYWTEEQLQEEANKYKNRNEFKKFSTSAHHAAVDKKILNKLFQNHTNKGYITVPNNYWTEEKLQNLANKYKSRREFELNNKVAYAKVVKKGELDKLFENHINKGYITVPNNHWSEDMLQDEANKYETRTDFYKQNNSAYSIAYKNGILNKLFENHINNGYLKNKNL